MIRFAEDFARHADPVDQASALTEMDLLLAVNAAGSATADQGGDGTCIGCGQEIPLARLAVIKGARRCIRCQRASEAVASIEMGCWEDDGEPD